jgi:glutamate-1-semialdehyde 2,1-aminomutase
MEPTRSVEPDAGFLQHVRRLCDANDALLIFDEITAGWRFHFGGAHLKYEVVPDIAVFAKALGNGHPMGAVIGSSAVMQAAQESFISSTAWTEGVGPVAAIAALKKLKLLHAPAHVADIGSRWGIGLRRIAGKHKLPLTVGGPPALGALRFDHPHAVALQTLFTVRMLDHGFLAGGAFYPSCAHRPEHVDAYLAAAEKVFPELNDAIAGGDASARVGGAVRHSGFARLT